MQVTKRRPVKWQPFSVAVNFTKLFYITNVMQKIIMTPLSRRHHLATDKETIFNSLFIIFTKTDFS